MEISLLIKNQRRFDLHVLDFHDYQIEINTQNWSKKMEKLKRTFNISSQQSNI